MPQQLDKLPAEAQEQVGKMPPEAQNMFAAAFSSASDDGMSEQAALNVAWNSLKHKYVQGDDGSWHRKPEDTNIHNKSTFSGGN